MMSALGGLSGGGGVGGGDNSIIVQEGVCFAVLPQGRGGHRGQPAARDGKGLRLNPQSWMGGWQGVEGGCATL